MSFSHETIERFNTARTRMLRLKLVRSLPLTALRTFEVAARHGSFTRAAEELHVTQGAVSRQVKALEATLGVNLFERNGRALALSIEGRILAGAATGALEQLGEAISKLTAPAGLVTLSMLPSIAACWMAPRMSEFASAHPDVELRLSASQVMRGRGCGPSAVRPGASTMGMVARQTPSIFVNGSSSECFAMSSNAGSPVGENWVVSDLYPSWLMM